VDRQTSKSWEHLVQIDDEYVNRPELYGNPTRRRWVEPCGFRHNNYGNSCRHNAWERSTGEWIIHVDDDNFLSDNDILLDMQSALEGLDNPWAIFPILRHGRRFFYDPPGCCYVDTANMVMRREFAKWPDGPEYTMDGIFCDRLKVEHPNYAAFPDFRPIIVMPASNEGKR
jgi:hypothetical protein